MENKYFIDDRVLYKENVYEITDVSLIDRYCGKGFSNPDLRFFNVEEDDLELYEFEVSQENKSVKMNVREKVELECYIQNSINQFEDTLRNTIKKYDVRKIYDLRFKIQLIPLIEIESEEEGNK